jgi:hypothetical protein
MAHGRFATRLALMMVGAALALIASLISLAHAAAALGAADAEQLLAHGSAGLATVVVLGALAPIGVTVGASVFLIRRIVSMFDKQLTAQQAEREKMAMSHADERQEAMKAERAERESLCQRHQDFHEKMAATMEALVRRANGGTP